MNRTILIVEPSASGHRLHYVRILVASCIQRDLPVVVLTTPEAQSHENWALHLGGLSAELGVMTGTDDILGDAVRASRDLHTRRTVIPDGDHYISSLVRTGWAGSGKLSVLVMRANAQSGSGVARALRTGIKRTALIAAGTRRAVEVHVLRSPLDERGGVLRWVPDPVELSVSDEATHEVRRLLARHAQRKWIGVFGRVTERKNLPLILRALEQVSLSAGLLIGGSVDDDVEVQVASQLVELRRRGIPVVRLATPVSDELLDSAIASADCVVAAHSNEGPSGIVAKSASAARPMVLSGARSLRRDAARLPGQAEWVPLSASAIASAIERALTKPSVPVPPPLGSEEFVGALIPETRGPASASFDRTIPGEHR